jgi:hypothetical protein
VAGDFDLPGDERQQRDGVDRNLRLPAARFALARPAADLDGISQRVQRRASIGSAV